MPRCHSCGAACGARATTRSKPTSDSFNRPARKSSMAMSRISRGFSLERWAHADVTRTAVHTMPIRMYRTRRSLPSKVEADERVVVANIDESIGNRRQRAHDAGQHLRACQWLECLWRCRGKNHL